MHAEELGGREWNTGIPGENRERLKDPIEEHNGDREDGQFRISLDRHMYRMRMHESPNEKRKRRTSFKSGTLLLPTSVYPASSSAALYASTLLISTAKSCGVFPSSFFICRSAPASTTCLIQCRFPRTTAQCSGVSPVLSRAVSEAPDLRRMSTEMASP